MSGPPTRRIGADALRDLEERLLAAAGVPHEAAMTTADVLMEADLRGYGTHGLLRLPNMIRRLRSGMIRADARPRVLEEREATALVDAGRALGPVGATYGASLAARKAGRSGCAAVGVIHCDHICLAGYYAERIARAGCVGVLASVTQPLVHPLGGAERLLGTNPLAVAIPAEGDAPILLDFATSAVAFGTVLRSRVSGEALPEGAAIDAEGAPTVDARAAASLAPFGGHKGAGLCFMIGLLAGPLLGAKVGRPLGQSVREGHYDKGDLLIAIDPAAFGDPAAFREAVAAHVAEVKGVKRAPGVEEIRVPGERSLREREGRLREGVPIEPGVWQEVCELAEELGVAVPA